MDRLPAACRSRSPEPLSRRALLRAGGLGLLGLSLPELFAAEARAAADGRPAARARSCILVFLTGGPSQFETFDPKPDAPSDYRTIFGVIPTAVPGLRLCEHLSDLAPLARRFALVRSAWHPYGGHFGGQRYALSGGVAPGNVDQPARPDDRPGLIGLAGKHLAPRGLFPPAVMLPWVATDQGTTPSGGMGGGTLGKPYNPFLLEVDPATLESSSSRRQENAARVPRFRMPALTLPAGIPLERFEDRRGLLGRIEAEQRLLLQNPAIEHMDGLYQRACDLLTSSAVREGFDLDQEEARLRQRYGLNAFGQSCLLARRLVERGARFVQVNFGREVTQRGYGWDTHGRGQEQLQNDLLPRLNAGLASLLNDLDQRGLLEETLVVAMGEFGRTPRVKKDGGRDHWSQCYSLLLAGGGIHGGLVHGRSDRTGARPADDPVEARDLLVTVLTLLGMPTATADAQGRVAALFEGAAPVEKLYL